MKYRHILEYCEQPKRTVQNDYETFIASVRSKVCDKIVNKLTNGETTLSQLYSELGSPLMRNHYDRLETPYDLIRSIIKDIKDGKLLLAESSWGKYEVEDENKKGTCPGLDDFFPHSYGYNTIGGPTHDIYVTKDSITIEANHAHQEISGWDTINIDVLWETRTFVIKNPEGDLSEENLGHFRNWIIRRTLNMYMDRDLDNLADTMANEFMK